MITNDTAKKEDPKAELQKLANWIVIEELRPGEATCTNDEFDAVLQMFEEDCKAFGIGSAELLITTTAHLCQALAPQPKPFPAPPLRVLSKLRPKA
jgi:hypothetical protein